MHPNLKYTKFYPSSEACCIIAFEGAKNCKVNDKGCTVNALLLEPGQQSNPPPVPAPAATPDSSLSRDCAWHADRIHRDGCTNDDNCE